MTNTQEPTKQTGTVEDACEDDDTSSPSACMARCMLWIRSGQDIDDRNMTNTHVSLYVWREEPDQGTRSLDRLLS